MALTTITMTNAHGTFATTGYGLDRAIATYLPASPNELRRTVSDAFGYGPEAEYAADVSTVSELLIMLAELDDTRHTQRG